MTSKEDKLRELVKQIQKLAAPPPAKPAGYQSTGMPPAGGGGTTPTPAPAGGTGQRAFPTHGGIGPSGGGVGRGGRASDAGIKKMQEKLISLSKIVLSQMKLEDLAQTDQPRAAGNAAGRGSFGDFLAKRMRQSSTKAVEFDPSKNKTKQDEKQPTGPHSMTVLMDTMQRIGGPKAEFSPDGVWGFRTNAALQDVHGLGFTLLKLAKDFGLSVSYNDGDLRGFAVPKTEKDVTQEEKVKLAPIFSQHIDAITKMFNEIKDGILENPQYQTYIENDTPYATYGKTKPAGPPGSPEQQQPALLAAPDAAEVAKVFPQFTVSFSTPNGGVQQKAITINDILTLQAINAWQKKNGLSMKIPDITNQIRQQVSLMPRKYTPQQDQAWQDKQWQNEKDQANDIRKGKQAPGASYSAQVGTKK